MIKMPTIIMVINLLLLSSPVILLKPPFSLFPKEDAKAKYATIIRITIIKTIGFSITLLNLL